MSTQGFRRLSDASSRCWCHLKPAPGWLFLGIKCPSTSWWGSWTQQDGLTVQNGDSVWCFDVGDGRRRSGLCSPWNKQPIRRLYGCLVKPTAGTPRPVRVQLRRKGESVSATSVKKKRKVPAATFKLKKKLWDSVLCCVVLCGSCRIWPLALKHSVFPQLITELNSQRQSRIRTLRRSVAEFLREEFRISRFCSSLTRDR